MMHAVDAHQFIKTIRLADRERITTRLIIIHLFQTMERYKAHVQLIHHHKEDPGIGNFEGALSEDCREHLNVADIMGQTIIIHLAFHQ